LNDENISLQRNATAKNRIIGECANERGEREVFTIQCWVSYWDNCCIPGSKKIKRQFLCQHRINQ